MKGSMVPTGNGLTWTERVRLAGGCWEAQGDWRRRAGPGRGWALGRGDPSELAHARQECLRGGETSLDSSVCLQGHEARASPPVPEGTEPRPGFGEPPSSALSLAGLQGPRSLWKVSENPRHYYLLPSGSLLPQLTDL